MKCQSVGCVERSNEGQTSQNCSPLLRPIYKIRDVVFPKNPVTGVREFKFLPVAVEKALGTAYYEDVCPSHKISKDSKLTKQVTDVFKKLVSQSVRKDELDFEIRVMEDDKTVNAFCLPGGKITITTALLKKLREETVFETGLEGEKESLANVVFEDRLAAVLGHEISHACAGHGRRSIQLKLISFLAVKAVSVTAQYFFTSKSYEKIEQEKLRLSSVGNQMSETEEKEKKKTAEERGRTLGYFFDKIGDIITFFSAINHSQCNELEADKYGVKLAAKAGYMPEGAIWLQHKFMELKGEKEHEEKPSFFMRWFKKSIDLFSSHPPSLERLKANRITVQTMREKGFEAVYPGA